MNNNKIILTALISGLLSFNASASTYAGIIKSGKDIVLAQFPEYAPKAITDPGTRLSLTAEKTTINMRNIYSPEENYMTYIISYNIWDPNDKIIKTADTKYGPLPQDGKFKEVILPEFATDVKVSVKSRSGQSYPGMKEMTLCGYDNYIYKYNPNTKKDFSIIELTFFKNDKNELAAKVDLPQSSKNKVYRANYQFNSCSTQSGAPGDQPEVSPDDNGWEQPGR